MKLALSLIRTDGGTQIRAGLNPETVKSYAADKRAGAKFPAVIVFFDGTNYWLSDGFHRVAADFEVGATETDADVRNGTLRDAILFACGANSTNSLFRSNEDKQRAVDKLVSDSEWSQWSDREIARRCGVDHVTVGRRRAQLVATGEIHQSNMRTGADGRTTNIGNIGHSPKTPPVHYSSDPEFDQSSPDPDDPPPGAAPAEDDNAHSTPPTPDEPIGNSKPPPPPTESEPPDARSHRKWNPGIRVLCTDCNEAHADWIAVNGSRWACGKCGVFRNADSMEEWQPDRKPPRQPPTRRTPDERLAALGAPQPNTYRVILADPPWQYDRDDTNGAAEKHYPTMALAEICALPIAKLAAPDCALFLWGTWPKIADALTVMGVWGFEYRTCAFVWAKLNKSMTGRLANVPEDANWFFGNGFWTRGNTEFCLLGIKGSPPRMNADVRQLIVSPLREHSRKPDEQYERIERLLSGPYLELFARYARAGWHCWGNQIESSIQLPPGGNQALEAAAK